MSVALIYGPKTIFNCESAFDEQVIANVTSTADSAIRKQGVYSSKFVVAAGFTTGIVGTKAITSLDCSGGGASGSFRLWIYSTVTMVQSNWSILLDDTANCASPILELNPGIVASANTWTQLTISGIDFTTATAIISVGLRLNADLGAQTIYLDKIEIVSLSKTYTDELNVEGFDNPEHEEGFPESDIERLLDGSWFKTPTIATTRDITIDFAPRPNGVEFKFLREWYFASEKSITYNSETVSVEVVGNQFPSELADGFKHAKQVVIRCKEKTPRLLSAAHPTSWA